MRIAWTLLLAATSALIIGMPVMPEKIPGDRLIANLEAARKKDPKNPRIEYLIGRAHYATYSSTFEGGLHPGEVYYFSARGGADKLPDLWTTFGYVKPWDGHSAPAPTAGNLAHIRSAALHLRRSLDLQPGKASALAHLTLACVFESSAPIADKVKLLPPFSNLTTKQAFLDQAGAEYLMAFDLAFTEDKNAKTIPLFGLDTLISFEAARSYLRVEPRSTRSRDVAIALAKFNRLPPPGMVTPLIFSLDGSDSLGALLDGSKAVDFNLDGTGRTQRYTWVKPTTGFLVWDPEGDGHVDSGRRLFGTATWWMLWSDAYEAMRSIDDDQDGWLTGHELKGIAVWFDRNQNGKSDPGEVVSLSSLGIESIATKSTGRTGNSLYNFAGVLMRDGRLFPTYDWVTSAVPLRKPKGG